MSLLSVSGDLLPDSTRPTDAILDVLVSTATSEVWFLFLDLDIVIWNLGIGLTKSARDLRHDSHMVIVVLLAKLQGWLRFPWANPRSLATSALATGPRGTGRSLRARCWRMDLF